MHKDRLLTLADFLENSVPPKRFNMNRWCGTVCCAGGWACQIPEFRAAGLTLQAGGNLGRLYPFYEGNNEYDALAAFFNISLERSEWLFHPGEYDAASWLITPGDVATRIRELIAAPEPRYGMGTESAGNGGNGGNNGATDGP